MQPVLKALQPLSAAFCILLQHSSFELALPPPASSCRRRPDHFPFFSSDASLPVFLARAWRDLSDLLVKYLDGRFQPL